MIVTRKKPVEQVLAMLHGVRRVALVGCGNCAAACGNALGQAKVFHLQGRLYINFFHIERFRENVSNEKM